LVQRAAAFVWMVKAILILLILTLLLSKIGNRISLFRLQLVLDFEIFEILGERLFLIGGQTLGLGAEAINIEFVMQLWRIRWIRIVLK
jgi:hypothetical protein